MKLTTNDNLTKSLEEAMQPVWEKQLEVFYEEMNNKLSEYYKSNKDIWKEDENFKKTLFTIAGGTLTIFASLGANNSPPLMNVGFFLVALSMICGISTQIFSPEIRIHSDANIGLSALEFDEKRLAEIKSHIDQSKNTTAIMLADFGLKSFKDQLLADKNKYNRLSTNLEKMLRRLKLDIQKISNWQKYIFLIGVLIIATSILIPIFHQKTAGEVKVPRSYLIPDNFHLNTSRRNPKN